MNERMARALVFSRAGGRCERCDAGWPSGSVHHRRNRSQLPKDRHWEVPNLGYLCGDGVRGCHGWVTANPKAAHEEGWHLHAWEEAEFIPVRYHDGEWRLLLPDGGTEESDPIELEDE